ncbi:hypothetical protein EN979_36475, partial [Mesorhizobium sp. M7A.F.Ca.US.001.04.2.1]
DGYSNTASGTFSGQFVTGSNNTASGASAGNNVTGDRNTATGFTAGSGVKGQNNTANGVNAGTDATGDGNAAVGAGAGATVTGDNNTASGNFAGRGVEGDNNIANGASAGNIVEGDNNVASGTRAGQFLAGNDNIAIGQNAGSGTLGNILTVNNSIALGADSLAGQDNAVAIGAGVTTTRAGQVAIGDGAATYTFAGVNSAASKAAQSGPTYLLTSDGAGNLATSSVDLAGLEAGLGGLTGELAQTRTEARQGIAAAIAMTTAPMPSAPGRTSWATNLGYFKGETAFGASLAHRLDLFDEPFAVTAGYAYGGGESHAARIGLAGEF